MSCGLRVRVVPGTAPAGGEIRSPGVSSLDEDRSQTFWTSASSASRAAWQCGSVPS